MNDSNEYTLHYLLNNTAIQMATQQEATYKYVDTAINYTISRTGDNIRSLNRSVWNGFTNTLTSLESEIKSTDQTVQALIAQLNSLRDMISNQHCE